MKTKNTQPTSPSANNHPQLKANLDLYGVLLKFRECETIFSTQYKANVKIAGFEYEEILDEFYTGLYKAMSATKNLIGESALNEVYDIIPTKK